MFATDVCSVYRGPMTDLTARQRHILEYVDGEVRRRGYPPSVREIGEAVGLSSTSTVHAHLAALQDKGYLVRDPTKPRAIEIHFDGAGAAAERRPVAYVPLIGDVAAGTGVLASENVEEVLPLPEDFTGTGELFALRVRGESMIDAGILDGDLVIARRQETAENGETVVAGIPGDEATVKTYLRRKGQVVLRPENPHLAEMVFPPDEVAIFGKVVTVMRRL